MSYYKTLLILFLLIPLFGKANTEKKIQTAHIIQSSEAVLKKLDSNSDLINFQQYLENCRAILIFPEVIEGGFILGAKGGNGLLLIRKSKDNLFSGPFFYSIGGVSVGLQLGAKSGKVVMTIMTNRGLKSVLKERIKLGVDVDIAYVNEGVGYSAESTARLADIYSFSDNSGLFIGSSLEGSYLQPRNDLNRIVHGREFSSDEIIKSNISRKEIFNLKTIISKITDGSGQK
tara:strand:+ start:204 stop:896 length:693 start_codon:yes stop_codon:yes gene_type:complete